MTDLTSPNALPDATVTPATVSTNESSGVLPVAPIEIPNAAETPATSETPAATAPVIATEPVTKSKETLAQEFKEFAGEVERTPAEIWAWIEKEYHRVF